MVCLTVQQPVPVSAEPRNGTRLATTQVIPIWSTPVNQTSPDVVHRRLLADQVLGVLFVVETVVIQQLRVE